MERPTTARRGSRILACVLALALFAGACDSDGSDREETKVARVLPEVDIQAVHVVDLIEVADAASLISDVVGLPDNKVRRFLALGERLSVGPADVAGAVVEAMTCLNEQGKLEFQFYQDRDHPQSVGIFFATELGGLTRLDTLECAARVAWDLLGLAVYSARPELPDPLPTEPVLEPCFDHVRVDGVEVVYIASTNWMCAAFAGDHPQVPCADGTTVHPRNGCASPITTRLGATNEAMRQASSLTVGFDLRHRGMRWRQQRVDLIDLCDGELELVFSHRGVGDAEVRYCDATGVEIAQVFRGRNVVVYANSALIEPSLLAYLESDFDNDLLAQSADF